MTNRVSVYLEQEILSANNLQLIHILYQAAISELREARRNMAARRIAEKCENFSRACALIGELLNSLDLEAGGEIAVRLKALYEYMLSRLLLGNAKNQEEPLAEVLALLSTLDEGWKELARQHQGADMSRLAPSPAARFAATEMDAASNGWTF